MPIVVNTKSISTTGFDQDALTVIEPDTDLLNLGNLITTGDRANGIFASFSNVSIRNNAKIETFGAGAGGILVQGADAHVENHGTIITHGGVFTDKKSEFFAEGIEVAGSQYEILNYGLIRVEGNSSSAIFGDGADGMIINAGTIVSTAPGGIVVFPFGVGSSVINTGQITVVSNHSTAISTGPRDGHLTNQGDINVTGDHTFGMLGLGNRALVENFGTIETHGSHAIGIEGLGGHLFPAGENISIVNGGEVTTEGTLAIGVALGLPIVPPGKATNSSILNTGVIQTHGDGAAGVIIEGDSNHLTNSGLIAADGGAFKEDSLGLLHAGGVVVSGDGVRVDNTATGTVRSENAESAAVELNVVQRGGLANANISSEVENFGLIEGPSVAIVGDDGEETVVNHGSIVGDVLLGDGADTFVFGQGGSLTGDLFLGGGKDRVIIEDGAGTAEIADLAPGSANKDVIDVSAFYSSFSDMVSNIHQVSNDTVIRLDADDQLILRNILASALTANDFFF